MWGLPFLLLVSMAAMATDLELDYQGRLLDPTGIPIMGTHDVRVRVLNHATAEPLTSTLRFSETLSSVPFSDGYFTVALGTDEGNALTADCSGDGRAARPVAGDDHHAGPGRDAGGLDHDDAGAVAAEGEILSGRGGEQGEGCDEHGRRPACASVRSPRPAEAEHGQHRHAADRRLFPVVVAPGHQVDAAGVRGVRDAEVADELPLAERPGGPGPSRGPARSARVSCATLGPVRRRADWTST
ncbi:MAG: hypothetical protein ACI8PZ_005479 [Myxococcota bacterium]|jgi:hypothetical protein